jgi:hypothetical protein
MRERVVDGVAANKPGTGAAPAQGNRDAEAFTRIGWTKRRGAWCRMPFATLKFAIAP